MIANLLTNLDILLPLLQEQLNIEAMRLFRWHFKIRICLWFDLNFLVKTNRIEDDPIIEMKPLPFHTSDELLLDEGLWEEQVGTLVSVFILESWSYHHVDVQGHFRSIELVDKSFACACLVGVEEDHLVAAWSDDPSELQFTLCPS